MAGTTRVIMGAPMRESQIIHIRPTGQASKATRNRINEHGSEGWIDMGAGVIISMGDVPYANLGRTLLRAVAHPNWFGWIDNQEWEEADNG